eukprot:3651972-Pleurochrysis_carterae.AAC.1
MVMMAMLMMMVTMVMMVMMGEKRACKKSHRQLPARLIATELKKGAARGTEAAEEAGLMARRGEGCPQREQRCLQWR